VPLRRRAVLRVPLAHGCLSVCAPCALSLGDWIDIVIVVHVTHGAQVSLCRWERETVLQPRDALSLSLFPTSLRPRLTLLSIPATAAAPSWTPSRSRMRCREGGATCRWDTLVQGRGISRDSVGRRGGRSALECPICRYTRSLSLSLPHLSPTPTDSPLHPRDCSCALVDCVGGRERRSSSRERRRPRLLVHPHSLTRRG
jgi:hypothetical protein